LRMTWKAGQSGNPNGRPLGAVGDPLKKEWVTRLRVAALREAVIDKNGRPVLPKHKKGEKVDLMSLVAEKVMEMARKGNAWAIEHMANRIDGKVHDSIDVDANNNVKIEYETYEEARAALLEEGIDIDHLPLLPDLRASLEREN
jgi:hypothetical protein